MSLQSTLKSTLKSTFYELKARIAYRGARNYFRGKTASYLHYLESRNLLKELPKEHAQKVVEYWTPFLSLSLSCPAPKPSKF